MKRRAAPEQEGFGLGFRALNPKPYRAQVKGLGHRFLIAGELT